MQRDILVNHTHKDTLSCPLYYKLMAIVQEESSEHEKKQNFICKMKLKRVGSITIFLLSLLQWRLIWGFSYLPTYYQVGNHNIFLKPIIYTIDDCLYDANIA